MSHVPPVDLHMYQGEDWTFTMEMTGTGAPADEATLDLWDAAMEIRKKDSAQTLLTRATFGAEITVVPGATVPTLTCTIPKATTKSITPGVHLIDMFLIPNTGDTFPAFAGKVTVTRRITLEEVTP